jgi:hypothetical protein
MYVSGDQYLFGYSVDTVLGECERNIGETLSLICLYAGWILLQPPTRKTSYSMDAGLGKLLNDGSLHDLCTHSWEYQDLQRVQGRHALQLQVTGQCGDG